MSPVWPTKSLGDVCHLIGGGTPSKKNEGYFKGDIPWATVRDMKADVITQTEFRITNEAVNSSSTNVIKGGNVVIATRVGLGKVCLIDQDTAINQDLQGIIPINQNKLFVRFLFWWLKSISNLIEDEGTGATVQGVKLPFVKALQIPLPPLPEQKRIVAILDKAFAGIAQAVAHAEKNLANARELFESYLNGIFATKGEVFKRIPLADLCDGRIITYGVIKLGEETPEGIPCLRTSNVRRLHIDTDGMKRIDPTLSSHYQRTILRGGEVLVNVRGTLGGVAVSEPNMVGWNVSREVAVVPSNQKLVDSTYLAYWIATKGSQDWLTGVLKGVAYTGINLSDLRELPIALPEMKEQLRIVETLDSMSEVCHRLAAIYTNKLTALAELKQSILQKAFAGELTSEPAELKALA